MFNIVKDYDPSITHKTPLNLLIYMYIYIYISSASFAFSFLFSDIQSQTSAVVSFNIKTLNSVYKI